MATIRQRGERWQCIVKRKGYPTQSKSFDLKKDAEKWGRLQERQLDAGQWVDRTEAEQTTFGDLLKRYAKEISSTKRGAAAETVRINALCRGSLAKYAVAAITGQALATWRDNRLAEVASLHDNSTTGISSAAAVTGKVTDICAHFRHALGRRSAKMRK